MLHLSDFSLRRRAGRVALLVTLLFAAAVGSCRLSPAGTRKLVESDEVGLQVSCPDARWRPAQGWGVKCSLASRALVRNGSGREIWYLGHENAEPVLYVTAQRDGRWEPLPSNVDESALHCKWYRLEPAVEVSGQIEAFANPEPIRIRLVASFAPPVGDQVEAFDVLGPRVELEEMAAR